MPPVALFVPCYVAALRPVDGEHAARVLRALGEETAVIDGRCCGQPAFNAGYPSEARTAGRELLRAATEHGTIVVPSGSCMAMVRDCLPGLWEGERGAVAARLAGRFQGFASYVVNHAALARLELRLEGVMAYHASCHSRPEQADALRLLGLVRGLELRRLAHEDECCGFGGTFAIKQPEISAAMMATKLADVTATGARVLVSADLSCLAHLDAGARGLGIDLETWSLAEVLSRALP